MWYRNGNLRSKHLHIKIAHTDVLRFRNGSQNVDSHTIILTYVQFWFVFIRNISRILKQSMDQWRLKIDSNNKMVVQLLLMHTFVHVLSLARVVIHFCRFSSSWLFASDRFEWSPLKMNKLFGNMYDVPAQSCHCKDIECVDCFR